MDIENILDDNVLVPVVVSSFVPEVNAQILDGSAIVQMFSPKLAQTFQDYTDLVFLPCISQKMQASNPFDLVKDV